MPFEDDPNIKEYYIPETLSVYIVLYSHFLEGKKRRTKLAKRCLKNSPPGAAPVDAKQTSLNFRPNKG